MCGQAAGPFPAKRWPTTLPAKTLVTNLGRKVAAKVCLLREVLARYNSRNILTIKSCAVSLRTFRRCFAGDLLADVGGIFVFLCDVS